MPKVRWKLLVLLALAAAAGAAICLQLQAALRAGGVGAVAGSSAFIEEVNAHIQVGEVRLLMGEDDIVALWGEGEYVPGFGGHLRVYPDKGVSLAFPDDEDHAAFGKVARIETSHPGHAVFGVTVGDTAAAASEKLLEFGFEYKDPVYALGDIIVTLRGADRVESISISFEDRNLAHRVY